ncbi:hypothetical protein FJT64_005585 [Amphibalanus amphitrite]|uniref:Uncharacterized protein n=1 Tax=Amphibalanus amphitrite TaxID=1232801 RepID=A0A6A4W4L3_AMPAM|nr:hypothetical protein FJT64_005585 [Amphibalanus amphitrite]
MDSTEASSTSTPNIFSIVSTDTTVTAETRPSPLPPTSTSQAPSAAISDDGDLKQVLQALLQYLNRTESAAAPTAAPTPSSTSGSTADGRPVTTRRPTRLSSLLQRLRRGAGGADLRRQGLAGLTVGLPLGVALMATLGASPALVAPLAAVIPGYVLAAFARARPPGSTPPATGEGTLRMVLRRFLAGQQLQLQQGRRRRRRELRWTAVAVAGA